MGLASHVLNTHAPEDEKTYMCKICDKKFLKNHMLSTHLRMKHIKFQDKKFECHQCHKRYINLKKLLFFFQSS